MINLIVIYIFIYLFRVCVDMTKNDTKNDIFHLLHSFYGQNNSTTAYNLATHELETLIKND